MLLYQNSSKTLNLKCDLEFLCKLQFTNSEKYLILQVNTCLTYAGSPKGRMLKTFQGIKCFVTWLQDSGMGHSMYK